MNSKVCVNCFNKKSVNQTDNRLVTESCGHVKCMDCLLHEKSGCLACLKNESKAEIVLENENKDSAPVATDDEPVEAETFHKEDENGLESIFIKKLEYEHIKVEMDGDKKCYICMVCKKKFHSRSQVCYHAYCNGQKKPHHCQICKQSFSSLSHYKYHMRVHNQERSFTCDLCSAAFYQMSKLKRHRLKHTKEKKYGCSECGKAFNNQSALRKHTLTHSRERPYECAACGRRFRDGSNYKKHVDKHKKRCLTCGEELRDGCAHRCSSSGGALGAGARAHACPRCRKAFHSRKDMRRHAAIHSDSKPFRCKACPEERRFRRKDNLERHIRNAHPDCSPTAALECDLGALQSVARDALTPPEDDLPPVTHHVRSPDYDKTEKTRLEILNPLPPLPQEVIRQHMEKPVSPDISVKKSGSEGLVDKKSIIEANIARQSVIVEKRNADSDKKPSSPENEYVHKIRKAIVPLPPIDQEKFRSVQRGLLPDSVSAAPSIKNVEIYKKILYEKIDKDTSEIIQSPKMHWRRKMEQDIN